MFCIVVPSSVSFFPHADVTDVVDHHVSFCLSLSGIQSHRCSSTSWSSASYTSAEGPTGKHETESIAATLLIFLLMIATHNPVHMSQRDISSHAFQFQLVVCVFVVCNNDYLFIHTDNRSIQDIC